ncbi:DUF6221 family protein [Streptomyces formicae]
MDDLARWYGEQLDTDERIARATLWDGSANRMDWDLPASATVDVGGDQFYAGDRTVANHIVAHDPTRVLREIDAKRRILVEHTPGRPKGRPNMERHCLVCTTAQVWDAAAGESNCLTSRLLALPYANRPGYREEWRP